MLLKWLFTLLAILWLYQALRDVVFRPRVQPPHSPEPPNGFRQNQTTYPKPPPPSSAPADDGEYIDYEEVK